jgi:hypothetical protein
MQLVTTCRPLPREAEPRRSTRPSAAPVFAEGNLTVTSGRSQPRRRKTDERIGHEVSAGTPVTAAPVSPQKGSQRRESTSPCTTTKTAAGSSAQARHCWARASSSPAVVIPYSTARCAKDDVVHRSAQSPAHHDLSLAVANVHVEEL